MEFKAQHKTLSAIISKLCSSKVEETTSRLFSFFFSLEQSDQVIAGKFNEYFVNSVSLINQSIELVDEPDESFSPYNI